MKRGKVLKVEEDGEDLILCLTDTLGFAPLKAEEDDVKHLMQCFTAQEERKIHDLRVVDNRFAVSTIGSSPPPGFLPIPIFILRGSARV